MQFRAIYMKASLIKNALIFILLSSLGSQIYADSIMRHSRSRLIDLKLENRQLTRQFSAQFPIPTIQAARMQGMSTMANYDQSRLLRFPYEMRFALNFNFNRAPQLKMKLGVENFEITQTMDFFNKFEMKAPDMIRQFMRVI